MKAIVAILVGATIGSAAACADCRVVRSRIVHHAVVVEPVVAAVFQPIAVSVPAYSVGYSQQSDPAILERLDRIAAALERMNAHGAAGAKAEPAFVALVRTNCAACHGINPKGNKLALFDSAGAWKEPTPELLGDMIAMVSSGKMPPQGRQMSADDRLKLIAGLSSSPAQEAAGMPPAK